MNTAVPEAALAPPPAARLTRQLRLVALAGALALAVSWFGPLDLKVPSRLYLPLHTLLEFASVAIGFLAFATVWHTPQREVTRAQILMGLALLCAGLLDLMHALGFKGMPDFVTPASYIKGIDFWLSARLLTAVSFALASADGAHSGVSRGLRRGLLIGYLATTAVLSVVIIAWEADLPPTYLDGSGVTLLKTALEVLITSLFGLAAWRAYRLAQRSGADEPAILFGALALALLSEQFFVTYAHVSDLKNLLGHLFKIACFLLIYRALFISNFLRPYQLLSEQSARLRHANDLLRSQAMALEASASAIVVTDARGVPTWLNPAAARMTDALPLARLSLYGAPLTPDPLQAAALRQAMQAGQSWRGRVVSGDARRQRAIYQRVVSPLLAPDGRLQGMVAISEDVTESSDALDWKRRVLETAIDGFFVLDTDHRTVVAANPAFSAMSGYAPQELLGMPVGQLEPTQDAATLAQRRRQIRQQGAGRFDTLLQPRTGAAFPVSVAFSYDPVLHSLFVFVRDLSEARAGEAQKAELQRQLQHAQKMELIGQLTGGIAHDFNNILASILGYSKLALDRFVPDRGSKLATYLGEVVAAAERARDLIARMMVFSRRTAAYQAAIIAPEQVIDDVIAMLRPSIPSSIELRREVEGQHRILADTGELHQILMNLIINARDAVGAGGRIVVRLRSFAAAGEICQLTQQRLSGRFVALEVSDTGCGIDPANLPRLFEPFFTTKEVGKGTGLGLPMVQGMVLRAHGHLLIESSAGAGTVFRVLFPPAAPLPAGAASDCPPSPHARGGQGELIWVVDDEAAIRTFFVELLETSGYRAQAFDAPAALLAQARATGLTCDLLITDQTMPGMSGLALAAELHRTAPALPVIMCTGYDSQGDDVRAANAGLQAVLMKPLDPDALLAAIRQALAASAAGAAAPALRQG